MAYRDRPRTRTERLGESFRIDPRYENLLLMSEARRETVLQSSPTMRIAFGSYRIARAAALELEQERTR